MCPVRPELSALAFGPVQEWLKKFEEDAMRYPILVLVASSAASAALGKLDIPHSRTRLTMGAQRKGAKLTGGAEQRNVKVKLKALEKDP